MDMCAFIMQNTHTPGEHDEFLEKIKAQVRCFKTNSNAQVYDELKNLKDYLHYRIQQREYDAKVAAAKISFQDFRRNRVEAELRKFDRVEKEKVEEAKWKWSHCTRYLEGGLLEILRTDLGTTQMVSGRRCLLFIWRTQGESLFH